jgi:hypothetical protein
MEDKKNNIIGISSSITLHAMLLLFLFFFGRSCTEFQDLGMDGGVEISLGEPHFGGPDATPSMEQVSSEPQPEPESAPESDATMVTSDQDDAPEVKQTTKPTTPKPTETKPKTETKPTETKPTQEEKKPDSRSMFGGKKPSDSQGSGSGNTPGNEGRSDGTPEGRPDGSGGSGSGGEGFSGDGFSGKIDGFKAVSTVKPVNERQEFGTVVIKVCVDRNGKVVSVTGGQTGTTTSSTYLRQISENAARKFKFQRIGSATTLNCGNIRFNYKAG